MPVVIGAKLEIDFADPIGLLTDYHRRIERFLTVLAQVGTQAQRGSLTSEQRTVLEMALRYFREAAPRHTAVEEREVFPVAAAVLGKLQRETMGGEMAARRGLRQSL